MSDDEFDALVVDLGYEMHKHIVGKNWEVVIWALAELLMSSVTDQEELDYVQEVLDQIGISRQGGDAAMKKPPWLARGGLW